MSSNLVHSEVPSYAANDVNIAIGVWTQERCWCWVILQLEATGILQLAATQVSEILQLAAREISQFEANGICCSQKLRQNIRYFVCFMHQALARGGSRIVGEVHGNYNY